MSKYRIFTKFQFIKNLSFSLSFLCFVVAVPSLAYAQHTIDSTITEDTKFELVNDTLVSSSGLKIYPGQKFTLGIGTSQNGRYRSIISKYAALVPNIWGHNNGYKYLIENYVDNKKGKKQLELLTPGQVLTLGRIVKTGKKEFLFYFTSLFSESNEYRGDILLALRLKELWFQ